MFARPKDWVDIESMAGQLQGDYVTEWVARLLGAEAPEVVRLRRLLDAAAP